MTTDRRGLHLSYMPKTVSGALIFFRCESILLNTHWVLVVMDQFTRRIIGFGMHAGDVDGVALCRMFNTAISTKGVQSISAPTTIRYSSITNGSES